MVTVTTSTCLVVLVDTVAALELWTRCSRTARGVRLCRVRPLLNPGRRRVWRSPDTVQFGVDVADPVILSGCDETTITLLNALDGARSTDAIVAAASPADRDHVTRALATIIQTPAVIDGSTWPGGRSLTGQGRARLAPELAQGTVAGDVEQRPGELTERLAATGVAIHGVGRLGAVIASMLAGAGLGRVDLIDDRHVGAADVCAGGHHPSDVGRRRADLSERLAEWQSCIQQPAGCTIAVVTDDCDARATCDRLCRESMPHLAVSCAEQIGRIGPFVLPSRTACLRCYDFTRTDDDSAWPTIAMQLGSSTHPPKADGLLVNATAAVAVVHLVDVLAGRTPPSAGGLVEVWQPHAAASTSVLLPHPACGCTWPRQAQDTMVG